MVKLNSADTQIQIGTVPAFVWHYYACCSCVIDGFSLWFTDLCPLPIYEYLISTIFLFMFPLPYLIPSLHLSSQSVQTTCVAGLYPLSVITLSSLSNLPPPLLYLTLTLTLTFHFLTSVSTSDHRLTTQHLRLSSGAQPRQEHQGFQPYYQHSERSLGGCHRPSPAVPGGLFSCDWRQAIWVGEFPSTVWEKV